MKTYKQLTFAQRYEIALLRKQGKSQQSISDAVGVSKSSISRELARNSASGKYEAEEAQRRCVYKKSRRKAYKLTDSIKADIVIGLKADLSPEQIVGQSSLEQKEMVSHETIYRFVYNQQKKEKQQKEQQKEHDLCWLLVYEASNANAAEERIKTKTGLFYLKKRRKRLKFLLT